MFLLCLIDQVSKLPNPSLQFKSLSAILRNRPRVVVQYWGEDKGERDFINHLATISKHGEISKEIKLPNMLGEPKISKDSKFIAAKDGSASRTRAWDYENTAYVKVVLLESGGGGGG